MTSFSKCFLVDVVVGGDRPAAAADRPAYELGLYELGLLSYAPLLYPYPPPATTVSYRLPLDMIYLLFDNISVRPPEVAPSMGCRK
jgi:hypothetical protein